MGQPHACRLGRAAALQLGGQQATNRKATR